MSDQNADIAAAFSSVHGRRPSFQEMLLLKEAARSVVLDPTWTVDDVNTEVTSPEGGYSVQGPTQNKWSDELRWRDAEVKRLKGLLKLSLESAERSWREGWDTRESFIGKVKKPDPDRYNPYKISDDSSEDGEG